MREINLIVIHCADTPATMDIGAKDIRKWHVEERGWRDIGYHFVIRRDGTIETGRSKATAGAHAKGYNGFSLGVCLVGGKGGFNFTQKQITGMNVLVNLLCEEFPAAEVVGHCDLDPVNKPYCPGFDVKSYFVKEISA